MDPFFFSKRTLKEIIMKKQLLLIALLSAGALNAKSVTSATMSAEAVKKIQEAADAKVITANAKVVTAHLDAAATSAKKAARAATPDTATSKSNALIRALKSAIDALEKTQNTDDN